MIIGSIDNKYIRIERGGGLYSQNFNEWYYKSIIKDLHVIAIVLVSTYGEMDFEYDKEKNRFVGYSKNAYVGRISCLSKFEWQNVNDEPESIEEYVERERDKGNNAVVFWRK